MAYRQRAMDFLVRIEKRFTKCCQQIDFLESKLDYLQVRFARAVEAGDHPFLYTLHLQIATIEGMRNVYYRYAEKKLFEIAALERLLFDEDVDISDYVEIPDGTE